MKSYLLHRLLLGCICLSAWQLISAQSKLTYGVTAITLGRQVETAPTVTTPLEDWTTSPVLNKFYKAGGEAGSVTPTQTRIAWTGDSLYVLFHCPEPNMDHPGHFRKLKLTDHIDNSFLLDTYFPDRVDVYIRSSMGSGHFYQFSMSKDGQSAGVIRGQLTQVKNPEGGGDVIKDRNARLLTRFTVDIKAEKTAWMVLLKLPWSALNGKPVNPFGLLFSRTRWRDSERTSPVAVDFDDRPAPDLFIETNFGAMPAVISSGKTMTRLPSGNLRWQRPVQLVYPTQKEKATIWAMQQMLRMATKPESLADRVHLTQRWCDLLTLEGFNFRKESGGPIPYSIQPYDIRRKINQILLAGNVQKACDSLDVYLKILDKVSRNWYADGSPGNILNKNWLLFTLKNVKLEPEALFLEGILNEKPYRLTMQFPSGGGIRLHGEKTGYFNPVANEKIKQSTTDRQAVYSVSGQNISVRTGADWQVTVQSKSGQFVLNKRSLGFCFDDSARVKAVQLTRPLDPKTIVRGSGERYNTSNLNGQTITLWGMDDYIGLTIGLRNQTYKPVPFFQTSGYSLFFNSTYRLRADLGQSEPGTATLTAFGPVLDFYFWPQTPDSALQNYTSLTGKPIVPPLWAFKPWLGRTGKNWNEESPGKPAKAVLAAVRKMDSLGIAHSAVYAEGQASDDPDLHKGLEGTGIRPLSWWNSSISIDQQRRLLPGFADSLLPVLRHADGKFFLSKHKEYVDFSHPNAMALSRAFWKRRLDLGIAGSMIDFGDEVPEDAVFYDGRKGSEMHNFYAYDYHRTFAEAFNERRGADYILFGRAASAGSQRWVASFAGDLRANFTGLRAALTGALNLSACGFSIWSSDMGGFFGQPDPEVYVRWLEFSTFSPLMRTHGTEPREPWHYGEEAVRLYRHYAKVRLFIADYLFSQAALSNRTGLPMIRSMMLAFPDQLNLAAIDDQYLLGTDMLVAPVLQEGNTRQISFPKGSWKNFWTGEMIEGGITKKVNVPPGQIPVYLRAGSMLLDTYKL